MSHGAPGERNLGTSGGFGRSKGDDPTNLTQYSSEPQYDLATMVQLVGVRPMILWGWEQQLGIPAPTRLSDEMGGTIRRYSERDLIASIWLRDQILKGVPLTEAAARLLAVQQRPGSPDDPWDDQPSGLAYGEMGPRRGPVNTGPLPNSTLAPRSTHGPVHSGALGRPAPATTRPLSPADYETSLGQALPSGKLGWTGAPQASKPTGNLYADTSGSQWVNPVSGQLRPTSGPLPQHDAAPHPATGQQRPDTANAPSSDGSAAGMHWVGPGITSNRSRELHTLQPQLIRAFVTFDTFAANRIVSEALAARSVETVCISLFQPVLNRVADLWSRREMSSPEEHFAVNYVRGVLFAILHKTPERYDGPLAIVGCGQRELQDTAALMLAVFWRRAGLRVVYLGQNVEGEGLVAEVRERRPALVALAVTSTQRIRSLARVAKEITQMEAPRPIFAFGGPIFERNADLQRKVSGVYLGDDAATATWHVKNLLGIERTPA